MPARRAPRHSALLALLLSGCGASTQDAATHDLQQHVDALLAGRESATVSASQLTGFAWRRLCFARGDALRLTFDGSAPPVALTLPYDAYFVDEAYVAQSPAGRCVDRRDRLVIARKYPHRAATIEFRLPR